jgi:hypothetical protein
LDFRVKASFVRKLKDALVEQLETRRFVGCRVDLSTLGYTGVIDLTDTVAGPRNGDRPAGMVTQAVVTLAPELRGFSKDNTVDFEAFTWIRDTSASYKMGKLWLERGPGEGDYDVPYMHEAIAARGLFPPCGTFSSCTVGSSARRSIVAV